MNSDGMYITRDCFFNTLSDCNVQLGLEILKHEATVCCSAENAHTIYVASYSHLFNT